MSVTMPQFLHRSSAVFCQALAAMLPPLSDSWWETHVQAKLSFQQLRYVEQRGVTHLNQLDLAALLRILDQNWSELSISRNWPREAKNFVREMQTVRNRWAHSQVSAPRSEDVYRDLDTLERLLTVIVPDDLLVAEVRQAKGKLLLQSAQACPDPAPPGKMMPAPDQSRGETFVRGDLVVLRADPATSGAVTSVTPGEPETRYQVFHDGKINTYYETQLTAPIEAPGKVVIVPLDEFQSRLSALQILHPSVTKLYSLHAARIDVIPYQFRPVLKFIQSDRPRLLIADSVGVGKTIEAGLILRELQARREIRRVLIVCPRPLVTEEKWRREMKRFDERFEHLDGPRLRFCIRETDQDGEWPERYEKVILPFSLLTQDLLKGLVDLDRPPQFDLVIVDEAHHIRNVDTQRHKVVRFLCENAEAVVFLTATPIQLGGHDLYVLLNTLRPDVIIDEAGYAAITEPNPYINEAALAARRGEEQWAEHARQLLFHAIETPWGQSVLRDDPRFQAVYDSLVNAGGDRDARVDAVRGIEGLHTLSGLMNRTLRRDIGKFTQRKAETVSVDFTPEQRTLHDAVLRAQAAVYRALHGDRSVNFMLTMIRRQTASCIYGLAPLLRQILSRRMSELEWDEMAEIADDAVDPEKGSVAARDLIDEALHLAEELESNPAQDPKFIKLHQIVAQKQGRPNNKLMLFSSFRHTLAYLYHALRQAGVRVGLIHGSVDDVERTVIRSRFEKDRTDPEALDVLLFSEVGCEGLDYQFCDCIVNYDIPWNPMRIDQRIGRIDRWGQESAAVAIYNFITPGTIDAEIYERCLLRIGVFEQALGANEEILGMITRELTSVGENLSLSANERQAKLEQIADNSIRLHHEQQSLEERQDELFGLRLPAVQFEHDVDDASSHWLAPDALQRLVRCYLRMVTGREESPLLGDGEKKTLRVSRAGREALLVDFKQVKDHRSAVAREWEAWLRGADVHLAITFDSTLASREHTLSLITPIHPLAVQAARALAPPPEGQAMTLIEVRSSDVSADDHPFAVYRWQYHGIRSDVEFKPVTADPVLSEQFLKLLPTAEECATLPATVPEEAVQGIEAQHYRLWSDARAEHIEETKRIAGFRRGSLETSHRARMAILDSQLALAENERIRTMKKAQAANAQADYDRRLKEIDDAVSRVDIIAHIVAWGIVRVRGVNDADRL